MKDVPIEAASIVEIDNESTSDRRRVTQITIQGPDDVQSRVVTLLREDIAMMDDDFRQDPRKVTIDLRHGRTITIVASGLEPDDWRQQLVDRVVQGPSTLEEPA